MNFSKILLRRLLVIKPLWLRNKMYHWFSEGIKALGEEMPSVAPLAFAPRITMQLERTDCAHQVIARVGFYEFEISEKIVALAKRPGSNFMVDVGANYGYYSLLWAGCNRENRAVAFEPSVRVVPYLKSNISHNHLQAQVEVIAMAAGKHNGESSFDLGPNEETGWGGLLNAPKPDSLTVQVITLDEFLSRATIFQYIDVLKIDTEGADTWVLQGAKGLLEKHKILHIFFEQNLVRMQQLAIHPREAHEVLRSCGYRVIPIGQDNYYAAF